MRRGSIVLLGVAIIMGLVAAFLARAWLQAHTRAEAETGTIVVAAVPLAFGTQVTEDRVAEVPWSASKLPDGAFGTKQQLLKDGRRMTLGPIGRDEPILASKVTQPGQRGSLSSLLEEGMRAVTVRVDDVRGVAGFILPGDRVDVVLIRDASTATPGGQGSADLLLQNVRVLAVDQLLNDPDKANVVAKAVTLAVTPEQSQKVLLASNIGKLSLTLRQASEEKAQASERITEQDLGFGKTAAPAAPITAPAAPAKRADTATIVIIRDMKREEYSVRSE